MTEFLLFLYTKKGVCVFFLSSSPKNPARLLQLIPVPLPPALACWRRRSLPSLPLSGRCLRSLVPLPTAGCAFPWCSGEQGNSRSCQRPDAWLRSPLAYPRTGNGGRRQSLSPPRGRWPPPPPSALPTELDSVVVGSDREAHIRARRGLFGPVTHSNHDDASATASVLSSSGELPRFPEPFGV
jgi:hypothetical protein